MIVENPPFSELQGFLAVIIAWIGAQTTKALRNLIQGKRLNFRWFIDTGGMPSSHSAGTSATAIVVGLYFGFQSIIFLLALVFAVVTMFDAAGVRRSVGKQAIVLNKMMEDLYAQGKVPEQRVREFLGHTPVEVLVGSLFGIAVAWFICTL